MEDPSMSILMLLSLVKLIILLPAMGRGSYACPANALAARIGHSNAILELRKLIAAMALSLDFRVGNRLTLCLKWSL